MLLYHPSQPTFPYGELRSRAWHNGEGGQEKGNYVDAEEDGKGIARTSKWGPSTGARPGFDILFQTCLSGEGGD